MWSLFVVVTTNLSFSEIPRVWKSISHFRWMSKYGALPTLYKSKAECPLLVQKSELGKRPGSKGNLFSTKARRDFLWPGHKNVHFCNYHSGWCEGGGAPKSSQGRYTRVKRRVTVKIDRQHIPNEIQLFGCREPSRASTSLENFGLKTFQDTIRRVDMYIAAWMCIRLGQPTPSVAGYTDQTGRTTSNRFVWLSWWARHWRSAHGEFEFPMLWKKNTGWINSLREGTHTLLACPCDEWASWHQRCGVWQVSMLRVTGQILSATFETWLLWPTSLGVVRL